MHVLEDMVLKQQKEFISKLENVNSNLIKDCSELRNK